MNKYFAPALYKDNMRRNAALTVVAVIWMYLGGMLDVTMRVLRDAKLSFLPINAMLKNNNAAYMIAHLLLPIIAAVTVFSYLNKVNSSNAYNAWPLNRKSMYATNWLSGFTICFVPLLINLLFMLAFVRDIPGEEIFLGEGNHVYTAAACFSWFGKSVLIEFFVYSVAVLGCVLTGNGIISFLTASALNFVIPALVLCCYMYVTFSCWGFTLETADFFTVAVDLNPWLRTMIQGLGWLQCLLYLAAGIGIVVLGAWVYHLRDMERATDSYVFEPVRVSIAFLLTFFFTTLSGALFYELWSFISYVPGFVIGFIVSQMVCYKSLRIFNKKVLRNLLIYAVLIVIVIVCSAIDILGVSKKVPEAAAVESVEVYAWSSEDEYAYNAVGNSQDIIEKTIDMHQSILDNKLRYRYFDEKNYDEPYGEYRIRYELTNGKYMTRRYSILSEPSAGDEAIKAFKEAARSEGYAWESPEPGADH